VHDRRTLEEERKLPVLLGNENINYIAVDKQGIIYYSDRSRLFINDVLQPDITHVQDIAFHSDEVYILCYEKEYRDTEYCGSNWKVRVCTLDKGLLQSKQVITLYLLGHLKKTMV
jgi:hypothetical protein